MRRGIGGWVGGWGKCRLWVIKSNSDENKVIAILQTDIFVKGDNETKTSGSM